MKLNNKDITKLPTDVRKTYKQLKVMLADKKRQNRAKEDFLSFHNVHPHAKQSSYVFQDRK